MRRKIIIRGRDLDKVKTLNRTGTFLMAQQAHSRSPIDAGRDSPDHIPSPHSAYRHKQGSDDAQSSLKNSPSADLADASVLDSVAKDRRNVDNTTDVQVGSSSSRSNKEAEDLHAKKKQSMQSMYRMCAYAGISVVFI